MEKEDDKSGRQRWKAVPVTGRPDHYTLNIVKGRGSGDRNMLSVEKAGTSVDLSKEDDKSGRQQWLIPNLFSTDNNDREIRSPKIGGRMSRNRGDAKTMLDIDKSGLGIIQEEDFEGTLKGSLAAAVSQEEQELQDMFAQLEENDE